MDIIFLQGLQIDTVIGIYEWERQIRQTVILDLEMGHDIREAAMHDEIAYTLDYKAVYDRVSSFVRESQFGLVETLAEQLCALLMHEFSIPWVRLTVNKRGAVGAGIDVGIRIERGSLQVPAR